MPAAAEKQRITLASAVGIAGVASAVISTLTFVIGRASVVSDLRHEISRDYVSRAQYATDQQQVAQTLADIKASVDYLVRREIEKNDHTVRPDVDLP
jgi:hypothetical protein